MNPGANESVIRVVGLEVCRADDAHGVVGHEDVAVGGPHAAVNDRVAQSVVHRDHDAGARDDIDAVAIRHGGDLSGPGAAAVEDKATFDAHVLAPALGAVFVVAAGVSVTMLLASLVMPREVHEVEATRS